MKKYYVIKCPKCGWEYLPEEIYVNILGKPKNIIKDDNGKILFFDGETTDLHEEFICDNCGCTFTSDLKLIVDTKVYADHDFSEDYSVPIYGERFELKEPKEKGLW